MFFSVAPVDVVEPVTGTNIWTFLADLWNMACSFLNYEISLYGTGVSFTLFEALVGFTIVSVLFYAVFRPLE